MKKKLPLLLALLFAAASGWTQVITTASSVTICTGPATVQIPVKVSSFTAVGSISLKLSYVTSELNSPIIVYKDPGLDTWGTFQTNMTTPGTIIISAYDPDVAPPIPGLTLSDNTTLFTLEFNIGTITTPAVISFVENVQGTSCEYGGVGPNYTPFVDTPTATYYINGSAAIVPDPVAPAITKNPADASVCAGQNLTVTTSAGSGGTGTIADEYRYSTNNGTDWSAWGTSVPSFAAVVGNNRIQSRRTATGTGCNESSYNEVAWTVVADPVAPGITKVPNEVNVCAGLTLSVNTSAGSGGTGTITDEFRYSTNNGGAWSSWSTSAPSFSSVVGTNIVQSRRTATGTGCDVSPVNEVSWNVAADPVAPGITKSPTDASVCAGVTLTVTTSPGSGGVGTISDQYRYSTNNGTSWSTWSSSVPSFTAIAGINKIQSRRTATGTGCNESTYNEVSWTVNAKQKISGTFNYHNSSGDILLTGADITVNLYKSSDESHSTLIATDVTDANGYYEFAAICPDCDYDIVATSSHTTEGAINTTDAGQANYWNPNPYTIEKVRFHAGDVAGPNRFIGSTDAARIQQNFVSGTPFDKAPWTFWRAGFSILHNPLPAEPEYTEYYPKVTLAVGSDIDADMYGLATGDFNRSFNPALTKSASTTLALVYSGTREMGVNHVFDLPVRMVTDATVGAISLVLDFPLEFIEVQDITMSAETGMLRWAVKGNELRISWHSPVPLELATDDVLLTLRLKTTAGFTSGNSAKITLASNPLNELADEMYDVIGDAVISIESANAAPLGVNELNNPGAIGLSCYPNPSHDFTVIAYNLTYEGHVTLEINSLQGYQIETLVNEMQDAGDHICKFDTNKLPAGLYTATLRLRSDKNESAKTIKLVIK
jgi:hypothetical protein